MPTCAIRHVHNAPWDQQIIFKCWLMQCCMYKSTFKHHIVWRWIIMISDLMVATRWRKETLPSPSSFSLIWLNKVFHSNAEEKTLSNAERRINQKSLKRMRYKKKIKKNKPGGLDKVQFNPASAPQHKRSLSKQLTSKKSFSKPGNRKQGERKNAFNKPSGGKRKREGIQTHAGKKTKFN